MESCLNPFAAQYATLAYLHIMRKWIDLAAMYGALNAPVFDADQGFWSPN
ncbi:MAG: hypothetical protein WCB48_05985 [Casimicrobiaceae bacterium]